MELTDHGGPPVRYRAEAIVVTVPAKINLALLVRGRRDDGYHEIESLVAAVALYDELVIRGPNDSALAIETWGEASPGDVSDLVWRSASCLGRHVGAVPGAFIGVRKSIPTGAGLGGGSADAAGALAGLNAFWRVGLSDDDLCRLAAGVGADVPLFFKLPAAIIRGIGEKVEPVAFHWPGWLVLAVPPMGVSTAAVYQRWRPEAAADNDVIEAVLDARAAGAGALSERLVNMLERPAFGFYPELGRLQTAMQRLAGRPVRLTGSGSGLFALSDEQGEASRLADRWRRELGVRTWLLRFLTTECI